MTYDVAMMVPGLPFDGDTIKEKSLGGSETAGYYMARELARLGHRVHMFTNTDRPGSYDGVYYRSIADWANFAAQTPTDACVVQRAPQGFSTRLNSKVNLLWCHDLSAARNAASFRGVMWNIDKVMVLSQYMKGQYKDALGIPDSALWQTRNGIDLSLFKGLDALPRDPKTLVFASRPERGLDLILERILPRLLKRDPELRLVLAGYENPVEHMREFYARLASLAEPYGEKVSFAGHLTKDALYRLYAQAGCYIYPTPSPVQPTFAEVSCITAMECQAAGLPMVTSRRGALPETLAEGSGILIDGDPSSPEYADRFADAVIGIVGDQGNLARMSAAGRKAGAKLDWCRVAQDWTQGIEEIIAANNDSPIRLARHFIRRSEVFGARAALEGVEGEEADGLRTYLDQHYGFLESPEAMAEHYRKGGEATDKRLEAEMPAGKSAGLFVESDEPRFHWIEEVLRGHPECERILDFGCGHGWLSVYMHNRVGRSWTGVDLDAGAVKWSRTFAERHAKDAQAMAYVQGDHTVDLSGHEKFDCLIVSEVLEHVVDPYDVIEKLERWLKPDALVIVTVPMGPFEFGSWNWENFRNHVRDFDSHDLNDIFMRKPGLDIAVNAFAKSVPLDEWMGFYAITYRADQKPVGRIDMKRKLRLQRPQQTVSVCIMAGPGAETQLGWVLEPLRVVANEFVVADTGMSPAGRAMFEAVGARIFPAPDPKVAGFEVPRNIALENARGDFILWIDTDERLLDPEKLHKYLRTNMFNGYSIRQHHFAVDTTFAPDMPVRLFRRAPYEGKTMRFYGMIHEHPELGLNEGPGHVIIVSDVNIAHTGYLTETIRRQRFFRNRPLLLKDIEKYPDRMLQKHFIMRDNMLMAGYELQHNGGQVTERIKALCEEVCDLWRAHFKGRPVFENIDSLQYYSQALGVLNKGIEFQFSIAATKDGETKAEQSNGHPYRFANAEEAREEILSRVNRVTEQFEKAHW